MTSNSTIDIFRRNLSARLEEEPLTSMRNLSTSIGASDSYIRKILYSESSLSLDKVDDISEFFDVNSWELFYDAEADKNDSLATLELINRLPTGLLPVVRDYIKFLLEKQES
ncbi:MAG: hypothetical protein LUC83_03340 [Clostridiales bacterium]|nr:hypothetical protein [Clostridiales bacterium]